MIKFLYFLQEIIYNLKLLKFDNDPLFTANHGSPLSSNITICFYWLIVDANQIKKLTHQY